ncbi:hypothetical protein [Paenibacillus campinasensis]|uniref:Uncharacterized protein n=1 Tax=Paenibacillus campinasensis TaxID=66347 RepID=A0A268EI44_9BACL|nr:hypothetical protein [Paenibacillus campinasensis]PAD72806.1 hypothetical protein CHH67_21090 [Paenibacillus campinasensis]
MNLHHVYVNRNETMQPKSLHEQLREIEEKIAEEFSQDLKGERISDQFNEWRKKHKELGINIRYLLQGMRDTQGYIDEQQAEIDRLEQQVKQFSRNMAKTKQAKENREYASLLVNEIIPRFKEQIQYSEISIQRKKLVLDGYSWPEAIRMRPEPDSEEIENPVLF